MIDPVGNRLPDNFIIDPDTLTALDPRFTLEQQLGAKRLNDLLSFDPGRMFGLFPKGTPLLGKLGDNVRRAWLQGMNFVPESLAYVTALVGLEQASKEISAIASAALAQEGITPDVERKFKELSGKPELYMDPDFWIINGARMAPALISMLTGAGGGVGIASGIAKAKNLGPLATRLARTAGATAFATPIEGLIEASTGFQAEMESTGDVKRAAKKATTIFGNNIAFLTSSNAAEFGLAFARLPIPRALRKRGVEFGAKVIGVGLLEAAQEVTQNIIPELEGFDPTLLAGPFKSIPEIIERFPNDPQARDAALLGFAFGGLAKASVSIFSGGPKGKAPPSIKVTQDQVDQVLSDLGLAPEIRAEDIAKQQEIAVTLGVMEDAAQKGIRNDPEALAIFNEDQSSIQARSLMAEFDEPVDVNDPMSVNAEIFRLFENGDVDGMTALLDSIPKGEKFDDARFKVKFSLDDMEGGIAFSPKQKLTDIQEILGAEEPEIDLAQRRIQPSPLRIPGIKPKRLSDTILGIENVIGGKFFYGDPGVKHAMGKYDPRSAAVVVRFEGGLDTASHELGHKIDDAYGILGQWVADETSPFDAELAPFAAHGSQPPEGHVNPQAYIRGEGVAEWFRAYMVNPDAAKKAAPKFHEFFLESIPDDVVGAINQFSNDVRVFAGASGRDQVLSQVDFRRPKTGLSALTSLISKNGFVEGKGFQVTTGDRVVAAIQNDMRIWEKSVEYAQGERGITEILPQDDPRILAALFAGNNAKIDDMLANGLVDVKNNRIKDPVTGQEITLKYLYEPLDTSDQQTLREETESTVALMISERILERSDIAAGKSPRASKNVPVIAGVGKGIFTDVSIARRTISEFRENPERFKRLTEAARRYRFFADQNLRYLRDKGRLAPDQYDAIKDRNEFYVAMQRVQELAPGEEIEFFKRGVGGNIGNVINPIKKFKGSARDIRDPYASLLRSTQKSYVEADRNEILVAYRDLLIGSREIYGGEIEDLSSIGTIVGKPESGATIDIYINGEREIWKFSPEIFASLKGIIGAHYRLPWAFTFLPTLLRQSIVNSPPFAVRNVIRDTQNRLVITRSKSTVRDMFNKRGAMDTQMLKLFGGDQAGWYGRDNVDWTRAIDTAMRDLTGDPNTILVDPRNLKESWNKYLDIIQESERVNRRAEFRAAFKRAKEQGLDNYNANLKAAYEARKLIDFAVAGHYGRVINQVIPFTNAAIQGMTRSIIAFRENPAAFMVRYTKYVIIPTLMVRALNNLMGDDEEYRQQPSYLRDLFYNFKLGDDLWLRIPRPYDLGIFAAGMDRAIDVAMGVPAEKAFDGYAGSFFRTLLPFQETDMAGPYSAFMEAITNYDLFRQKNIIPVHEQNLDLDLRRTDRASRFGRIVQEAIGVDSRKIDFFMRRQFGFFGQMTTKISDIGRDERRQIGLAETGLFVGSPAYAAKDVQWVMDTAKRRDALRDPSYRRMTKLISKYFDADTNKEKDVLAERLRGFATDLRAKWTKRPPKKKKARKNVLRSRTRLRSLKDLGKLKSLKDIR